MDLDVQKLPLDPHSGQLELYPGSVSRWWNSVFKKITKYICKIYGNIREIV